MNIINMKLTAAGQAAVLNSKNTGVSLDLSYIQFGSGNKTPDGSEIALITPRQYSQISSGLKISPTQIRMAAIFNGASSYDVCEIGVWSGVPGAVGSVLFAYCSNLTGRIASMSSGVDFIFSHDMAVDAAVGATLNIVVDPSGTAAASLIMAAHEVAVDPHSQYMTAAESNTVIAAAIAALVNSSPTTLDTLNEIALALGNDPNFAATITAALGTKLTQAQTDVLYLKLTGGDVTGAISQKFSGLYWIGTPVGGAFVRKYADVANAATVGGIEDSTVYNCAIDPATGVWAGRDVADLCWLEKWSDTGGQKEYWFAPTAAAGAVPAWVRAFTLDISTGKLIYGDGTAQSTLPKYNIQIISASGNFTTPANTTVNTVFKITILGAGGGGAGTVGVTCGGGGGAGGAASFLISGLAPSTSYAVVIGASGTPGAAGSANNGSTGGTTQITINGVVYSCSGGLGGVAMSGSGIVKTAIQGTVSVSITALPSAIKIYQFAQRDSYYTASSSYQVSNGGYIPFGQGGDQYEAVPSDGYGCGGCGGVAGLAGLAGRQGLLMAEWVA